MSKYYNLFDNNLPSAAPRIVKVDVKRFSIDGYDIDNGYPQRMETLVKASPTAKQAVNMCAKYITGQGFDKDQEFYKFVVNSDTETGDQLLRKVAKDFASYNGMAFHINYNALFQKVSVTHLPFETCRIGNEEKLGQYAIYNNWWNNARFGKTVPIAEVDYIDAYNPAPQVIKEQVRKAGGWNNYKGQIFWYSSNGKAYPEHRLDTAIDAMEAEILSNITSKSNIQNNFGDKVIYVEKGEFADDQERSGFKENMQGFVGPNGQRLIIAEVRTGEEIPEILTIENKLNDKIFQYSDEKSRATIYRMMGQPAILHSDLTQGRYNQNQLPEARKAYNNDTEMDRIIMQECFAKVFENFITPITADFSIKPLEDMLSATQNNEGANNGNTTDNIEE